MHIPAVIVLAVLAAFPVTTSAQTFGGVGTRAEGMAGAFVAVADDATAVYWNPAGIATGATFDLQVATGRESTLFVGAALPVLGVSYYRTRDVTGLPTVSTSPDRQNGGSGEVQVRTLKTSNIGLTVVQTIVPGLVIGTTARIIRGTLDGFAPPTGAGSPSSSSEDESSTTVDLDVGAMVSAWDMRFGVTGRNLREAEFQVGAAEVRMSRQMRVGAALTPRSLPTGVHGPFTLAIDVDLTATPDLQGKRRMASAGGEYWVGKGLIGGRAGVSWSTLGDSHRAIAGGFTVRLPRSIHFDGHLTKDNEVDEVHWTVGGRVTF